MIGNIKKHSALPSTLLELSSKILNSSEQVTESKEQLLSIQPALSQDLVHQSLPLGHSRTQQLPVPLSTITTNTQSQLSPPSSPSTCTKIHKDPSKSPLVLSPSKPELKKKIDFAFLPVKLAYFTQNLRTCCYMPFLILVFTSFGLSKTQAGLIAGLRLIGSITGNLFWGIVTDKSQRHSMIVVIQVIGAMLFMFPQPFMTLYFNTAINCNPGIDSSIPFEKQNNTNKPDISTVPRDFGVKQHADDLFYMVTMLNNAYNTSTARLNLRAQYNQINADEHPYKLDVPGYNHHKKVNKSKNSIVCVEMKERHGHSGTNNLFFALVLMNIGATFFDGSLGNLLDAVVIKKIQSSPYKVDFGRQRMFGTPSFVVATILGKHLVSMAPSMPISCYSVLYLLYALFITMELISLLSLLRTTQLTPNKSPTKKKYGKTLWKVCSRPSNLLFFGTMFIHGVLLSAYISYFIPFLKELLANDIVFDISFLINSLASLSGLAFSSTIIMKFGGSWNTFCISIAAFAVRFMVYSVITTSHSYLILLVEPVHMLCYAVFISAYVRHVKEVSPTNILNAMYGITHSLWFGFGFIFGNIFGGYFYDTYGGRMFYIFQTILASSWCMIILLYILVKKLCMKKKNDNVVTFV